MTTIQRMIAKLLGVRANGDPRKYIAGLSVHDAHTIGHEMEQMRAAMQEFVDRVDKGEVRSKRTYAQFKEILGHE